MILVERNARVMAEADAAVVKAEAANAQADLSSSEALNAHLKLEIEKLRRELYGSRSERKARLLEQMELQLEDLETAATEDELAAETAAVRTQTVRSFQRRRPSRKPFPDHLPRERIVIAAPESCPCCGSAKLSKLGEDITDPPVPTMVAPARVEKVFTSGFGSPWCALKVKDEAALILTREIQTGRSVRAFHDFTGENFGVHSCATSSTDRAVVDPVSCRLGA